jgi:hypothetical protein
MGKQMQTNYHDQETHLRAWMFEKDVPDSASFSVVDSLSRVYCGRVIDGATEKITIVLKGGIQNSPT